jgi:hypothetical protein
MDFSSLQAQLPSNQEAKPYVEVVRRLSHLLCLMSLLPVISQCRFTRVTSSARRSSKKDDDGKDTSEGKAKAKAGPTARSAAAIGQEEESVPQEAPLGVVAVLLLAASELCLCWELFVPLGDTTKKSSKKATDKQASPVIALVHAAKQAAQDAGMLDKRKSKKDGGMMDGLSRFIQSLCSDDSVFESIHGLVMLVILVIVLCYVTQYLLLRRGKSFKSQTSTIFKGLFIVLPVGLFATLQSEKIIKVWRALATEKVLDTLWLPLRAAALCYANPPEDEGRGGTPGLFAAFQVASIFGMISCELLSDNQGTIRAIQSFVNRPRLQDLIGSPLLSVVAPQIVAMAWLYFAHLSRRGGALILSVLCCCACQPVLLALGWPKFAAAALGESISTKSGAKLLLQATSVAYAGTFFMGVVVGGTLSFVGACALVHTITGIHGMDNLMSLFKA